MLDGIVHGSMSFSSTGPAHAADPCFCYFFYAYSGFEVREVFKKLPGGRGFALTEYEPVRSHGDPVHAPNISSIGAIAGLKN